MNAVPFQAFHLIRLILYCVFDPRYQQTGSNHIRYVLWMFCQKRLLNFLSNAFCRQSGRQQSTFLDSGFGTRFDAETQLRRKADRAQHSQSVESWFIHIPGIKVVAPSNPYDAKMVLKAAIECDDPVLYFENKVLYKETGEVPEKEDEVPYVIGKARVEREGKDVTIVSYSIGMKNARAAADELAKDGISAEVVDLITLSPWDKEIVINSVKKTHRLCLVSECVKQGGALAEVAATVAEEALEYLDAPILRYGAPFTPIPFAPTLEKLYRVYPEDLVKGIKGVL